jgi:N-acetylmuramic acid 6-phosphate etherase
MTEFERQADDFINHEQQFHLGFLPTEQSNPLTRSMEADFKASSSAGVRTLQRADRPVLEMAKRVWRSAEYAKLVADGISTIENGGRIIFSGCGATGRLSILLESMWRQACAGHPDMASRADAVESIMTGGDYALVRSVEFFEDYASFGRRQVEEAAMTARDMLVAITEGGETSSVLGTAAEALDRGCRVFLLFNNPAELLCKHLERSRKIIEDSRVCVLDLYCGPMALAGSTRMQATTSEQLIAGSALEKIFHHFSGGGDVDYAAGFEKLLDELEANAPAIADYIDFEAAVYSAGGHITYFADAFMLDIFTDTTERSPTFMLPPFKRNDDRVSPEPWAFVKNPLTDAAGVWARNFRRAPRCLGWTPADYEKMGAAKRIQDNPPHIAQSDFFAFEVGNAPCPGRWATGRDAAVLVGFDSDPALEAAFAPFARLAAQSRHFTIGQGGDVKLSCRGGALDVMRHMAIKLVLNTVSTGTMVKLGRVSGNWMSWVDCTNKKLLDRGTRLLVELAGCDYRTACTALFAAMAEQRNFPAAAEKCSPVQLALKNLTARRS